MRDPVLRPSILANLRRQLGQADVRELENASHFVQEDEPDTCVDLLLAFLERTR
jgi:pimeloyl-ACP methyl ester carboxylesterase